MPQSSQAIVPPPTPSALIFLERSILAAGATAEHDQALSSSLRYSCLLFKDEGEREGGRAVPFAAQPSSIRLPMKTHELLAELLVIPPIVFSFKNRPSSAIPTSINHGKA